MDRPFPPRDLLDSGRAVFVAAPEVETWAREMFIEEGSEFENDEHEHLRQAEIGFLWTNEANEKRGRMLLGTCQMLPPNGDKWSVGARVQQLEEWFGEVPDFLITLYAPAAHVMDNASFMALVEHELLHAGQKQGEFGPMFNKDTGKPIWSMRAHDVEQFVGVVRRYGADASNVAALVDAAIEGPQISQSRIDIVCGNCLRLVG